MGRIRETAGGWAGVALVVALLSSGCSEATAGQDDDGVPRLPPSGRATSIELPLDAYRWSPREQERSDRAQAAAERACLSRFGLTWSGPSESTLMTGRASIATERAERFGLVDQAQASDYGYHPPPWGSLALMRAHERDSHREAPDEVAEVLYGQITTKDGQPVPEGGCRGEAFRQLAARTNPTADRQLVTRLDADAKAMVIVDGRVTAMLNAWAECMARAGYDYPTPKSAAVDDRWERTQEPTAEEIAVAEADVACKAEVDYLDTMVAVTTEHQDTLIEAHADELDQVRRWLAVRADNVTAALSVPVPSDPGR